MQLYGGGGIPKSHVFQHTSSYCGMYILTCWYDSIMVWRKIILCVVCLYTVYSTPIKFAHKRNTNVQSVTRYDN
jgi:hypothetical protein